MGYKTAKELGLKVGDKIKFINDIYAEFNIEAAGQEATLIEDDGTKNPGFYIFGCCGIEFVTLTNSDGVPYFTKVQDTQPKLITHEEMKVGQKVKLISEGGRYTHWDFKVGYTYTVGKDKYGDVGPLNVRGAVAEYNWDRWVWELVDEVSDNSASEQINLLQAKVDELTDALSAANKKLETLKEFVENL